MPRTFHSPGRSHRRARGRTCARLGWLVAAVLVLQPGMPRAEVTELSLKAAFLFKFTQYAEWPEGALGPKGSPIHLCVLGHDLLAEELRTAIGGRSSQDRPLSAVRLSEASQARGCQVLFVGAARSDEVEALLSELAHEPILTVGDADGFAKRGGMINLAKRDNRLHFEINRRAVRRAGLQLSSQLLKLASLVDGAGGSAN